MRLLEAFTLGKTYGRPETNEDSLVVMPDRGYAVIDGVTDRNGTRYGGMLSGRFASRTVRDALERFLLAQARPGADDLQYRGPEALIGHLTGAIRDAYEAHGALAAVTADWKLRAGCTVMAALHVGDALEVVAVGDSGIRINGTDVLQVLKPLDDVTALLRREAWRHFAELGRGEEECDRLSTSMTWQGTGHQPDGSPAAAADAIAAIEARAFAAARRHLPQAPEWELLELIRHGIAHGQGDFQNTAERVLGYGGLDGFPVPRRFVESRSYRLADIETIELFSDGYFKPGVGFGVAAWEEAFRQVEAEDPHKIGAHMSTKGSTAAALADDRSYLGVRLR